MKNEIYDSYYYDGRKKMWKTENFCNGLPPKPSPEAVVQWLNNCQNLEGYPEQEAALEKLFRKLLPQNNDLNDILIKAATLNDFYSTNIYSVLSVAKIIKNMNLDNTLNSDKAFPKCIDELNDKVYKATQRHIYSFATKYFSHHRPDIYPIYDSYVDKLLRYYRDEYQFFSFKDENLLEYEGFYEVYIKFKEYFGLTQFTAKDIDKFLWQVGKHHFPKYKNEE